jgi:hypothetical protein
MMMMMMSAIHLAQKYPVKAFLVMLFFLDDNLNAHHSRTPQEQI